MPGGPEQALYETRHRKKRNILKKKARFQMTSDKRTSIKMNCLRKYASIIAGAGILAFGLYNVHARCAISEGGALGLSLLLLHWLGLSPGISNLVMDAVAFLTGTVVLKKSFLLDSIVASVCYALWYGLFEAFPPVLPNLSPWPWAAAIVGGLFVGVGTSLIVRHGCAPGADDALALVMQAKTGLHLSAFYVISDFTVLILSLTYIPLGRIVWSMLSVTISSGIIELLKPKEPQ